MKKKVPSDKLDRLFRTLSGLGRLQKCEPAKGQASTNYTPETGKVIQGYYIAKAPFEKAEGTIHMNIIKRGEQWQIKDFGVESPALVPAVIEQMRRDAQPSSSADYIESFHFLNAE